MRESGLRIACGIHSAHDFVIAACLPQDRAKSILERFASSLDTVATLKLLPPGLPLHIVTP
jgi:hypothetical protein